MNSAYVWRSISWSASPRCSQSSRNEIVSWKICGRAFVSSGFASASTSSPASTSSLPSSSAASASASTSSQSSTSSPPSSSVSLLCSLSVSLVLSCDHSSVREQLWNPISNFKTFGYASPSPATPASPLPQRSRLRPLAEPRSPELLIFFVDVKIHSHLNFDFCRSVNYP